MKARWTKGLTAVLGLFVTDVMADDALPNAPVFAASVLAGRLDLETFDFEAAGFWKQDDGTRQLWLAAAQPQIFGDSARSDTCDAGGRRRFIAVIWMSVLQQSGDAATWRANFEALRQGLASHDAWVQEAAANVVAANDSRVTELSRRVARDQAIRDMPRLEKMDEGMPPIARQFWGAVRLGRMMAIDCDDTEWLAAQIREIGWFDIPRYGRAADKDAWVLVQHADRSPAFQRETLARLEKLPKGSTDPRNVAYLSDRVAMGEGRPQRYGTQGKCLPDGTWTPIETEDPEGLDARRAALDLPPMAEYAKRFVNLCPRLPVK